MSSATTEDAATNISKTPDSLRKAIGWTVGTLADTYSEHAHAIALMLRNMADVIDEKSGEAAFASRIDAGLAELHTDVGDSWGTEDRERIALFAMLMTSAAHAFRAEFDVEHPLHGKIDRPKLARWLWGIAAEFWGDVLTDYMQDVEGTLRASGLIIGSQPEVRQ